METIAASFHSGNDYVIIVVAVIVSMGNIIVVIISGIVTSRNTRRAQEDARQAQLAVRRAEEAVVATTKVALDTHRLVNGKHMKLLRDCMLLSERVARENPNDKPAQDAAYLAREDYVLFQNVLKNG